MNLNRIGKTLEIAMPYYKNEIRRKRTPYMCYALEDAFGQWDISENDFHEAKDYIDNHVLTVCIVLSGELRRDGIIVPFESSEVENAATLAYWKTLIKELKNYKG